MVAMGDLKGPIQARNVPPPVVSTGRIVHAEGVGLYGAGLCGVYLPTLS